MKRTLTGVLVALSLSLLAGCASSQPPTVPSLGGAGQHTSNNSADRAAKVHAAAECIRSHGAPTYQDPVLDANGHVFTDARSIEGLSRSVVSEIEHACASMLASAGFAPSDEPPAPPALVAAGVRSNECLRQNGLPNAKDPTSSSPYTPGHGFGFTAGELPNNGALGKGDPAVQRAFKACRSELDAEIRASELSNLAQG